MFYQTRSNAIILQGTLPAHCIVKVERLKTGEKLYERQYLSLRPPPKISLKHDLNWTKGNDQSGSTVEHHPRLLGTGIQAGGSPILSTRLKDGMTTDSTGQPVPWWFDIYLREESQRAEEFRIFTVNKSVTAVGSLLSPTGGVKECILHLIFTNILRYTNGYGKLRTSSRTT